MSSRLVPVPFLEKSERSVVYGAEQTELQVLVVKLFKAKDKNQGKLFQSRRANWWWSTFK